MRSRFLQYFHNKSALILAGNVVEKLLEERSYRVLLHVDLSWVESRWVRLILGLCSSLDNRANSKSKSLHLPHPYNLLLRPSLYFHFHCFSLLHFTCTAVRLKQISVIWTHILSTCQHLISSPFPTKKFETE